LTPLYCIDVRRTFTTLQLSRSFSKSLDKLGRSDIGRYNAKFSGGFPGLNNMITCARFNCSGMYSVCKIALYMCVRWMIAFFGSSFSIFRLIHNSLVIFFEFKLLSISLAIYNGEKCSIFSCAALSGCHCKISSSESIIFGINTCFI